MARGKRETVEAKQLHCISLMLHQHKTQAEIAKSLGVTENTISNWKREDAFQEAYSRAAKDMMTELAGEAIATLRELLGGNTEMVRLMAAKEILDRAGLTAEDSKSAPVSISISYDYGS